MTPRIAKATPRRDLTVHILWDDGSRSTVDMRPYASKGGVLAPMSDPAFFVGTMKLHWRGDCLSWEGDLDFSAEGLWADSRRQTAAAE